MKGSWEAFCWLHLTNSNVEETTVMKHLNSCKHFLCLNGSLVKNKTIKFNHLYVDPKLFLFYFIFSET